MTLIAPRRRSLAPTLPLKVAFLAGSIAERDDCPRALTPIGGRPILWHNMKHLGCFGVTDFVVALGHRSEQVTSMRGEGAFEAAWNVDLVDTGIDTMSGGRIRRLQRHIGNGTFLLSTAEDVSDLDLDDLMEFHREHGRIATVVAVRPPARFGKLELDGDQVVNFLEKPDFEQGWTNGSFFVLEPAIFDYVDCDDTNWQEETLERLAEDGQLMAYQHRSFWQGVETLRDRQELEALWQRGDPPWKTWA